MIDFITDPAVLTGIAAALTFAGPEILRMVKGTK